MEISKQPKVSIPTGMSPLCWILLIFKIFPYCTMTNFKLIKFKMVDYRTLSTLLWLLSDNPCYIAISILWNKMWGINPLNAKLFNLITIIWIFIHLKLCLADAIHNFKWLKIIRIWQNGGQLFSNIADWCHILALTCLRGGTWCANKKWKPEYMRHRRWKG